ncbi:MAG: 50S ribosomal protein L11 methyltransferase [Pseudomonadota bacterium]
MLPDYTKGNPYQELYIYYLAGRMQAASSQLLMDFIGNWEEDGFSFLFFSKPARDQVEALLGAQPQLALLDNFHMRYEEWQGAGMRPMQIGPFHIRPPWLPPPGNGDGAFGDLPILLDPGVVFGTGTHATTKDCLAAVSAAMDTGECETVLDLGTGTGLLALAAARCGCRRCLAVDLNALAATTAGINVRLNHWEDRILVVRGRAENFIDTPADLLIANIHYDIMRQLIQSPGFLTKKRFILSGLMRSEACAVRDYLYTEPVTILREWSGDGIWHTFLGTTANEHRIHSF